MAKQPPSDPVSPVNGAAVLPAAPAAAPAPAPENWARRNSGSILTASVSIIIALVGAFATFYLTQRDLQEQLKVQAEQARSNYNLLALEADRQREEIKSLRDKSANVDVNFATNSLGNGRLETALNTHTAEIALMRSEVTEIHKLLAHVRQLANGHAGDVCDMKTKCDKLTEDLTRVRERLAAMEAIDSRRSEKLVGAGK